MMPVGTKVVFVRSGVAHRKVGDIGVIVDALQTMAVYLVEWEKDGDVSIVGADSLEDFHVLKGLFKRGPKLKKRDLGAVL